MFPTLDTISEDETVDWSLDVESRSISLEAGSVTAWSCLATFPFCDYTGCQLVRPEQCVTGMCV